MSESSLPDIGRKFSNATENIHSSTSPLLKHSMHHMKEGDKSSVSDLQDCYFRHSLDSSTSVADEKACTRMAEKKNKVKKSKPQKEKKTKKRKKKKSAQLTV